MKKTLASLLIAGAIGFNGLCNNNCYADEQSEALNSEQKSYQFKSIREISGMAPSLLFPHKIVYIAVADMDGDGDQDIIGLTGEGTLISYENAIPQKAKSSCYNNGPIRVEVSKSEIPHAIN